MLRAFGERAGASLAKGANGARGWQASGLVLVALALQAFFFKHGADLGVFELAGQRALSGEELYRLAEELPFKYSPPAALLLTPLALFPHRIAWALWIALSLLALWRVLSFSARPGVPVLAVVALHAVFIHRLFALGQIDALLLWLMVESQSAAPKRPLASGALWLVACLFKPPFLVFALLKPSLQRLAGLGMAALAAVIAALVRWHSFEPFLRWRALLGTTTSGMLCGDPENQGAFGLACRFLGGSMVAFAIVALATILLLWRARERAAFFWSAFLSPLCWQTNLLGLIPLSFASRTWAVLAAAALNIAGSELFGAKALDLRLYGLTSLLVAGFAALSGGPDDPPARPLPDPQGSASESTGRPP